MGKTETIVIRVKPLMKNRLERLAAKDRRSLSDWLRIQFENLIQTIPENDNK